MNYTNLLASIEQAFVEQDKYFFDRHIPKFVKDGKFLGDYFNDIAVESRTDKPPRFYHVFSPFDVISNKAPEYAAVFENGELVLQADFDRCIALRTAAMNTIVLKALGVTSLSDKKVLLFGSGRIASEAVNILASELGLTKINVITKSGDLTKIKAATEKSKVLINAGDVSKINDYDIIICHTQSTEPVITKEQLADIKQGAVLTSFISSTEHGEFPDEVFEAAKANIITDWPQTLQGTKDLKRALDAHAFKGSDLIYIADLLNGREIDSGKQYTVYRSIGTPIQNLAVLKLLLA